MRVLAPISQWRGGAVWPHMGCPAPLLTKEGWGSMASYGMSCPLAHKGGVGQYGLIWYVLAPLHTKEGFSILHKKTSKDKDAFQDMHKTT